MKELAGKNNIKKLIGFLAFVGTGIGLLFSSIKNPDNQVFIGTLIIFGIFYLVGIREYYGELIGAKERAKLYKGYNVVISTFLSVTVTWYLNHKLNLGPILANGIVGVLATVLLPKNLAAMVFTSSFVGMSSLEIIPNLGSAGLGGVIVGLVILTTGEIFAGIGGKGGTTAALSTIITKNILNLLG